MLDRLAGDGKAARKPGHRGQDPGIAKARSSQELDRRGFGERASPKSNGSQVCCCLAKRTGATESRVHNPSARLQAANHRIDAGPHYLFGDERPGEPCEVVGIDLIEILDCLLSELDTLTEPGIIDAPAGFRERRAPDIDPRDANGRPRSDSAKRERSDPDANVEKPPSRGAQRLKTGERRDDGIERLGEGGRSGAHSAEDRGVIK